jgi:hypothetical protein
MRGGGRKNKRRNEQDILLTFSLRADGEVARTLCTERIFLPSSGFWVNSLLESGNSWLAIVDTSS